MTEPRQDDVLLERMDDGRSAIVRLSRPHVLNALNMDMAAHIRRTFDALHEEATCRVAILTGSGRGLCAGSDLAAAAARNRDARTGSVQRMATRSSSLAVISAWLR